MDRIEETHIFDSVEGPNGVQHISSSTGVAFLLGVLISSIAQGIILNLAFKYLSVYPESRFRIWRCLVWAALLISLAESAAEFSRTTKIFAVHYGEYNYFVFTRRLEDLLSPFCGTLLQAESQYFLLFRAWQFTKATRRDSPTECQQFDVDDIPSSQWVRFVRPIGFILLGSMIFLSMTSSLVATSLAWTHHQSWMVPFLTTLFTWLCLATVVDLCLSAIICVELFKSHFANVDRSWSGLRANRVVARMAKLMVGSGVMVFVLQGASLGLWICSVTGTKGTASWAYLPTMCLPKCYTITFLLILSNARLTPTPTPELKLDDDGSVVTRGGTLRIPLFRGHSLDPEKSTLKGVHGSINPMSDGGASTIVPRQNKNSFSSFAGRTLSLERPMSNGSYNGSYNGLGAMSLSIQPSRSKTPPPPITSNPGSPPSVTPPAAVSPRPSPPVGSPIGNLSQGEVTEGQFATCDPSIPMDLARLSPITEETKSAFSFSALARDDSWPSTAPRIPKHPFAMRRVSSSSCRSDETARAQIHKSVTHDNGSFLHVGNPSKSSSQKSKETSKSSGSRVAQIQASFLDFESKHSHKKIAKREKRRKEKKVEQSPKDRPTHLRIHSDPSPTLKRKRLPDGPNNEGVFCSSPLVDPNYRFGLDDHAPPAGPSNTQNRLSWLSFRSTRTSERSESPLWAAVWTKQDRSASLAESTWTAETPSTFGCRDRHRHLYPKPSMASLGTECSSFGCKDRDLLRRNSAPCLPALPADYMHGSPIASATDTTPSFGCQDRYQDSPEHPPEGGSHFNSESKTDS